MNTFGMLFGFCCSRGFAAESCLKAKWSDIDWKQRTLLIPKTKNGEALLAPLSHAAIAHLKVVPQLQGNPYIICGRKAGQPLVNLTDAWSRIRTAAGLSDLRIHDLRRTVGSWLVRDGASLHLVGSVLNHKDQKTTAGYAYFQTKERHKALDKQVGTSSISQLACPRHPPTTETQSPALSVNVPPRRWSKYTTFTREALYKLVWSEPTRSAVKTARYIGCRSCQSLQASEYSDSRSRLLGTSGCRARMRKDTLATARVRP